MHDRSMARSARIAVVAVVALVAPLLFGVPTAVAQEEPPANGVTAYGAAAHAGPDGGLQLHADVVGMSPHPSGDGYWLVAGDGGVFSFGAAVFHGSAGDIALNQPIVGMAAHPTGGGYWFVAADGGVFSYGAAVFHGSMGGRALNQPIVGMAAHPSGDGYWLVARDGGIFSFGAAVFHGSAGDIALNQPIVGMAAHPSGDGYWFVAADGGIFSFGAAEFQGSMGHRQLPAPVTGMAASHDGHGYWMVGADGQVYEFGVTDHGSAATGDVAAPLTVGIAAHPGASGYWLVHAGRPTLERQDRGPHVERLQRRLESLGYWVGPIDGVFGSLTQQAVWAFQKYEALAPDGVVGDSTRAALDRAQHVQARSTAGDIVEIDKNRQMTFLVRDGRTLWAFNSPTGEEEEYTHEGNTYFSDTPTGRFDVFRQIDGWRESHLGRLYRPKYFTTNGIALHGSTFVPPYPVSHGCVRVTIEAMDYIWANDLVPIGTDVWVYGTIPS